MAEDSYFGIIGNSFYGGPNGQSFRIKQVFNSKATLDADLNDGMASYVQPGEFAIISYGDPNDSETYNYNRSLDEGSDYNATLWQKEYNQSNGFSYTLISNFSTQVPNFTLIANPVNPGNNPNVGIEKTENTITQQTWKLILPKPWNFDADYIVSDPGSANPVSVTIQSIDGDLTDEDTGSDTKLLTFTLPNPWNIAITKGNDLAANASPILTPSSETATTKSWILQLPQPWNFQIGQVTQSNPGGENPGPNVSITTNNSIKLLNFTLPKPWDIQSGTCILINPTGALGVSVSNDNTTKYINFEIPGPWNIAKGSDSGSINPNESATVSINGYEGSDTTGDPSPDTKYIHIKIPNAWNIVRGNVTLGAPNIDPQVSITTNNDNTAKLLNFILPVSQQFTVDSFNIYSLSPTENPNVVTRFAPTDTINRYPQVDIYLPRAAITTYGRALAATSDMTINSSQGDWTAIQDLAVGDYYINTTYAGVHRITTKTGNSATTTYLGSMQLAIPNIQGNAVNPYDANGNPVVPTVATNAVGPVASWIINVDTIKAPVFKKSADSGFVASTATGYIGTTAANDGITYKIQVPKGTKITTATEQPNINQVSKYDGDLYLDTEGQFYKYSANYDRWESSINIKGSSFLIKNGNNIIVTAANIQSYTGTFYEQIGQYIEATADYASYFPLKSNEILNVEYQPEANVSANYWLYKSNNNWMGSKLTGDASNNIIVNSWTANNDNKAYSITRINELRSTISTLQQKIATIEAAIEAAWGELPITE